ncbi:hypothetical protein K2173_024498 [Erythroxylum novogranatense]|uniref:AtPDCT1/2 transmembrane domain-containing protein n=1 Tax=Erythroxylum novogranatense TaxID=1862640 RepID=A0AAV8SUR5_9ROSI|nr:hypothetical protein K2173_024498 [Erythroxylum novogranatense]
MTATTITAAAAAITTPNIRKQIKAANAVNGAPKRVDNINEGGVPASYYGVTPSFMTWTSGDVVNVVKCHRLPCFSALGLLLFMAVEYTLRMIPANSQPFDLGFIATRDLHRLLSSSPELNSWLAGLNTVFVAMQAVYILWAWLVEGRPRATISTLFMFTCRGILGCSTQLPVPEEFVGSGVDFPVGNVSFFLFFSGHVAGAVIASLDMRRKQRWELAWTFDLLNVLQAIRLLGTRGHYTIDLAAGAGAGLIFDSLGGKYEESKKNKELGNITKEALFLGENKVRQC